MAVPAALNKKTEHSMTEATRGSDGTRPDSSVGHSSDLNLVDIAGGIVPTEAKKNRTASMPVSLVMDNPFAPTNVQDSNPANTAKPENVLPSTHAESVKAADRATEYSTPEAKLEKATEKDLPPGSVERLDARLTEMLAERNRHVDTFQAQLEMGRSDTG